MKRVKRKVSNKNITCKNVSQGIIENNENNPDMQNIIGQIKKALKELED